MGDYHVRVCERFGVKFPLPTRRPTLPFIKTIHMKQKYLLFGFLLFSIAISGLCQSPELDFKMNITFSPDIKQSIVGHGRLYVFFCKNPKVEPRTQIWPNPKALTHIFAKNISGLNYKKVLKLNQYLGWSKTSEWSMQNIPKGDYYIQVLWDQDSLESRINAPGNLYSEKQKISINNKTEVDININKIIPDRKILEHELARLIEFKSDTLSKWWNKPVYLKASILLPANYNKTLGQAFPVRYNVAGYGGRYDRVNGLLKNDKFMNWWTSDEAPGIINVFLDGEGPFGDSYQMDSENSGPYGHALINELIPYIESKYRGTNTAKTRFVDGCSTGGWVSLALQLYYPDFFNGAFSYSPDAVEFENYQLINIYKDTNAFVNEFNYLRPVMRDITGEPLLSLKKFIQYENVLGASNTYLNSGGQICAHTALYSPKGDNGLPKPLIEPETGQIDHKIAEHWKKYDFKLYAKENWAELGPKVKGKIFIWMGDMDHFYLNLATRDFADFLAITKNPKSDAEIIFSPMKGHCQQYSNMVILKKIQKKLEVINETNVNKK